MELLIPEWKGNVDAMTTMSQGGVSQGSYDDGRGHGGLNLDVHVQDAPEHVAHNLTCYATFCLRNLSG